MATTADSTGAAGAGGGAGAVAAAPATTAAVATEAVEETLATSTEGSKEDQRFDEIVGALETVMMDEDFRGPCEEFCRKHCDVFESSDENKLEYTTLFTQYTELTENELDKRLKAAVKDFTMEEFMKLVAEREDQIAGDVFDMLTSMGDFDEFKDLMLSYKAQVAFESGAGDAGSLLVLAPTVTAAPAPAAAAASASTSASGSAKGSSSTGAGGAAGAGADA